jgi:CHAD domain-containing protein
MAKAREIPGLSPDITFRDAAALAVETRAQELVDMADGVLDVEDIERVHDMRVATRRLRAVLEIFAPALPKREQRKALRDVKALADALGGRRDADVAIAALEDLAAGLAAEDRIGVQSLVDTLRATQQQANEELAAALASVEAGHLATRLDGVVAAARPAVGDVEPADGASDLPSSNGASHEIASTGVPG